MTFVWSEQHVWPVAAQYKFSSAKAWCSLRCCCVVVHLDADHWAHDYWLCIRSCVNCWTCTSATWLDTEIPTINFSLKGGVIGTTSLTSMLHGNKSKLKILEALVGKKLSFVVGPLKFWLVASIRLIQGNRAGKPQTLQVNNTHPTYITWSYDV